LRTGHCGLNYYLWRFKKIEEAECKKCGNGKQETVEHFLLECKGYCRERWKLRNKVGERNMKVETLLGRKDTVKDTMEYVEETKRFEEGVETREENTRR
jgi:hypothetical protein